MELYDNTRISAFKNCPRFYYYRHVRHWIRDGVKSNALVFGSAWHDAMDTIWQSLCIPLNGTGTESVPKPDKSEVVSAAYATFCKRWMEEGLPAPEEMDIDSLTEMSPRTPMIAMEMMYGYVEARHKFLSQCELIEVEKPFAVPIDPDQPNLLYVGRFDKLFRFNGDIYTGEHKTTSLYRKGGPFREAFIDSFSPNSQVDGYLFAGNLIHGKKMKAVWVDAALVHKDVHDGFKFIPVERAFEQLDSWLWETHYWIEQIRENKKALEQETGGYMAAFPKNTGYCYHYGNACSYIDLCKMWADPHAKETPMGYREEPWEPFDELKLGKLGLGKPAEET